MTITPRFLRSICMTIAVLATSATALFAGEGTLAEYFPDGAIGSVEVANLGALVERVENTAIPKLILESDGYKKWADSRDGRKFRGGQAVLEGQLGMGLIAAVKRIAGDQSFLAIYPPREGQKQPDGVLLVRLADDEIGTLLKEKLAPFVQLAGDKVQAEDRDGAWRLRSKDNKVHAAYRGRWIVASSTPERLDSVLKAVAEPAALAEDTLADSPAWKELKSKSQPGETRLTVCVDMQRIRSLINQERLLPAKVDNALGSLLIGGLMECAALAPRAQGSLVVGSSDFAVSLQVDQPASQLDAAHRTLFAPRLSAKPVLTPALPRFLSSIEISREWAEWYRRRDQLHEAKILPEFDKFETGLATFLPGKDFAEDVLALVGQPMTFVAAQQTYPHLKGNPGVQLPAFGVVVELNDPQKGADLFNVFFQTITAVSNVEAGKYGRYPWVLNSESHQGIQLSFAKYLQTPEGKELPLVYNFQPASALVKKQYIAATSLELCRDLVDALQKPRAEPATAAAKDVNFELNLDPTIAADMLLANRPALESLGLQQGKNREQIDQEMQAGQALLRQLNPWQLRTIVHEKAVELRLTGSWK